VIQRLNLEWLYRLATNPKKLSKVMLLPRFVALVLRDHGYSGDGPATRASASGRRAR
jgi:UDP-N-acetyl-D-mannosaminuronic acid transferase (WecB/TagA/CpsF family)